MTALYTGMPVLKLIKYLVEAFREKLGRHKRAISLLLLCSCVLTIFYISSSSIRFPGQRTGYVTPSPQEEERLLQEKLLRYYRKTRKRGIYHYSPGPMCAHIYQNTPRSSTNVSVLRSANGQSGHTVLTVMAELLKSAVITVQTAQSHTGRVSVDRNSVRPSLSPEPLPDFLDNYKNPCWREFLTEVNPYEHNSFFVNSQKTFRPVFEDMRRRRQDGQLWRVRCLPYFYIVGQPKCGTTDLFSQLTRHQNVTPCIVKEPHWWARKRLASPDKAAVPLHDYIDLYDAAAECITRNSHGGYHHMITGEASASTLWDSDRLMLSPEDIPHQLTAHYLHDLQPSAKLIVLLRNPTERLYSDYLYFHFFNKSAEAFHNLTKRSIARMEECIGLFGLQQCVYNYTLGRQCEVRLRVGIYYTYIRDWLEVFPRDQMRVIRLEDYARDRLPVLAGVLQFLEIGPLSPDTAFDIVDRPVLNRRNRDNRLVGPMLEETRRLLNTFYGRYNTMLAELLSDTRFLWK